MRHSTQRDKKGWSADLIDRYNRSGDDGGIVGLPGGDGDKKANHDDWRSSRGPQNTLFVRWKNIPLPEPHIAGILASGVLHLTRPWKLPGSQGLYSGAGWVLLGTGVAISASAVQAASHIDIERPSVLISTGPYAVSRNPMYIGWTLLYVGGALITRNAWMLASLPGVAGITHRDVLQEEQTLEQAFGEEYLRYQKLVRRYL